MKFQRSKITGQVRSILKINDKETAIKRIVEIIEGEHISKEHFRQQRDDAAIEAYNTLSAIKRILEICNEEYDGDEKINDIVKYWNNLT